MRSLRQTTANGGSLVSQAKRRLVGVAARPRAGADADRASRPASLAARVGTTVLLRRMVRG